MNKRQDYLSWDDYFMGLALLSAQRSKDPNTQVGACIVGENKKILSVGYNGLPTGYSDDDFNWGIRDGSGIDVKYHYIAHAELNAILNSKTDLTGSTVYVTLFPCNECAKAIIQSGIKRIVYLSNKYENTVSVQASVRMFSKVGVKFEKYNVNKEKVVLEYKND